LNKRKTAGEQALKAASDNTVYDPLEVAHALTDDICEQLRICAHIHSKIFDEDEFFLILVIASDPLIHGIRRHKYTAYPHMPQPRPQQTVFLFNKITQTCKRLWSLPNAKTMAIISEMPYVAPEWKDTKYWCDAFFAHTFFNSIRKQHGISHLSEREYLNAHRAELIQAGCNEVEVPSSDPFDFSKVAVEKIIDKRESLFA
jgi:hypothetical protein